MVAVNRAMQFQHAPAPGELMQAVDVLRNDRFELAVTLQLGKKLMRPVRLRFRVNHFAAVKVKKNVRGGHKKAAAQHYLRRIRRIVLCLIQPCR
ncbi:hypothetical protein D3C74_398200 [compost metagenome]